MATLQAAGRQSGAATLRMRFKLGERTRYRTTVRSVRTMPPAGHIRPFTQRNAWTMITRQSVDDVLPNGGARIMETIDTYSAMEHPSPSPAAALPITVRRDAHGMLRSIMGLDAAARIVELQEGSDASPVAGPCAYLPSHPVKPGDTWSQPVRMPEDLGGAQVGRASSTFVRYDMVGRVRAALLHTVIGRASCPQS